MWLQNEEFCLMVRKCWQDTTIPNVRSKSIDNLVINLKCLRKEVRKWEKDQKIKANEDFQRLEEQMKRILDANFESIFIEEDKFELLDLENQMSYILKHHEMT